MKNIKSILLVGIALIFLTSCGEDSSFPQETDASSPISGEVFHTTLPSGLIIDAFELERPPTLEPLVFVPISDNTQDQILADHEKDREQSFPDNSFYDGTAFCMDTKFGESELIACEECKIYDEQQPGSAGSATIEVVLRDEVLYTADAGDCGPITNLQGLWSYDQDWVLEYADITMTFDEAENSVYSDVTGHLVLNGSLLNERYSFQEIFSFQLLKGKPFFFYKRDSQIGISYEGDEFLLGFKEIPHYGCCSAGMLNPNRAQNMVSFFAQKEDTWYYVETGIYE